MTPLRPPLVLFGAALLLACTPEPGSARESAAQGLAGPGGNSSRRAPPPALVVPHPSGTTPAPAPAPEALEPVAFERLDTPAQIFEHAAAAIPRAPVSGAAPEPLELRVPSCPHRYEFRVLQTLEMLEAGRRPEDRGRDFPGPAGLWLAGSWTAGEASPLPQGGSEATLELALGELSLGHMQGHRRPGNSEPAGKLAPVRLRPSPRGWEEVDGPAALWSAYGSWYGLVTFNPGLPERWEPDAPSAWELLVHARGSGMRTEVTRGQTELPEGMSLEDLPEPSAERLEGSATLRAWVTLAGTKAARLVVHANLDASSEFELPDELLEGTPEDVAEQAREVFEDPGMSTKGSYDAHFVVLESGQLLHAAVVEDQVVTMTMGGDLGDMVQRHLLVAEARLVESCAGPVMPEFSQTLTPKEQALEHIFTLRNAAAEYPEHSPEPELITALLSPALLQAVPQASACLVDASAAYGALVFGTPELPAFDSYPETETGPESGRVIVELTTDLEREGKRLGRELQMRAEFVTLEGELRLDALSLRKRFRGEEPLLSLSPEGLSTQLPCAPAAPPDSAGAPSLDERQRRP